MTDFFTVPMDTGPGRAPIISEMVIPSIINTSFNDVGLLYVPSDRMSSPPKAVYRPAVGLLYPRSIAR